MKLYPIIVNDIDACLDPHKFEAYRKEDVDKALEEKDAKIKELEEQLHELAERECVLCKKKIKELEAENERLKAELREGK